MSAIPRYSIDENFKRIKLQKQTKFLVVEGIDDVPIYENIIDYLTQGEANYEIFHSGGKTKIKDFIQKNNNQNVSFIIDRDFNDFQSNDPRIHQLDRYSVENYFFCDEIAHHAIKISLRCKLDEVRENVSIEEFIKTNENKLIKLLEAIIFYQKELSPLINGERPSWSNEFICQNTSWQICEDKINKVIDGLLPTQELKQEASKYFSENYKKEEIIKIFPGKMLRESYHRFLKQKTIDIKPNSKGKFKDSETTLTLLTGIIYKSSSLSNLLRPLANNFV